MSPCEGCLKRMSDPQGNFAMKFVGRPGGKLMKGAPGNYVHGKTYQAPYHYSKFKFWELIEAPPKLVILEAGENVFEDAVFIPDDEESATIEMTPVNLEVDENPYAPDAPAIMEPYSVFNTGTGRTTPYIPPEMTTSASSNDYEVTLSTQEPVEEKLDRKELIKALDEAGVEYKKGARTTTLKKLVDELDPEE